MKKKRIKRELEETSREKYCDPAMYKIFESNILDRNVLKVTY